MVSAWSGCLDGVHVHAAASRLHCSIDGYQPAAIASTLCQLLSMPPRFSNHHMLVSKTVLETATETAKKETAVNQNRHLKTETAGLSPRS